MSDADFYDLIKTQEPAIRRAFEKTIKDIRDGAKVTALINVLKPGDIEAAVAAVEIDKTKNESELF